MNFYNLVQSAHPSWHECLNRGLSNMDADYLKELSRSDHWLPGPTKIFNAFSLPINKVNYVLFGESPYPRSESANGFAFWDAAVTNLWSETGMSKKVNRATSLRNILKMLLIAEDVLDKKNIQQSDIAKVNKEQFVQTSHELFTNFIKHGFLLLNATPILHARFPQKDARAWQPFTKELLDCLLEKRPQTKLILFGRIANSINNLVDMKAITKLIAEHPYNHSFITNPIVLNFFRPLHLLKKF